MTYFTETAEALRAALATVPALHAFASTPDGPQPGDAWPRWTSMEPAGPPGLFGTTWEVIVVTGGTPGDAHAFLDAHLSDILDAIQHLTVVTSVNPATFDTPGGTGPLYGVVITTFRE